MRQSFLGRIRPHLPSSEIPAQMGRPFRQAAAAYGFFPPLRLGNSERKGEKGYLLGSSAWAAATDLPAWVVTVSHFPRKESAAFKAAAAPKGKGASTRPQQRCPALYQLRPPRGRESPPLWTPVSLLVPRSPIWSDPPRGNVPEGSLPGDRAPQGRFPRRRLAIYPAPSPPRSLRPPLYLALGITRGLRTPSAGCPGGWLPALTVRWASQPAPPPGVPDRAPLVGSAPGLQTTRRQTSRPGALQAAWNRSPARLQGLRSGRPRPPQVRSAGKAWVCREGGVAGRRAGPECYSTLNTLTQKF